MQSGGDCSGCRADALRRGGCAAAKQRIVNVYNWSDYIDPAVLEDFTRETGIKVKYDTFDSNDMLETKLLAGRTGYDVVVPTAYFLRARSRPACSRSSTKASCRT